MTEFKFVLLPQPLWEWEMRHLDSCDSRVRFRRLIEMAVVRKLLTVLLDRYGYVVVDDGGDEDDLQRFTKVSDAMEACFAVDACAIHVPKGWVQLVFGNDGWDAVADYTVNLEEVLKPVNDYAETLAYWC